MPEDDDYNYHSAHDEHEDEAAKANVTLQLVGMMQRNRLIEQQKQMLDLQRKRAEANTPLRRSVPASQTKAETKERVMWIAGGVIIFLLFLLLVPVAPKLVGAATTLLLVVLFTVKAKAAAEAKALAEKQAAEAKAATEKRLEWTGKAMQRAGMKAETVKRTLTQGGTVVAWGDNEKGQTTVPAGLSGVVAIAGGEDHTVVLKQDGTVVAWGNNAFDQTTVPAGLSGVVAIAGGGRHTVALKQDGTVVAWGYNVSDQTTVPAGLSGVVAIAGGPYHTVALKLE